MVVVNGGFEAPAGDAAAVTPNDSTTMNATRGLYVGSGGNISVDMMQGGAVTFTAVPTGVILPVRVVKVNSTGTTASSILALY